MKRMMFVVSVLAMAVSGAFAAVALNQNFDTFTTGSLSAGPQGTADDVGGMWLSTGSSEDPSIVAQDGGAPTNYSLRLTGGHDMAVGYSTVAPIAQGTPFVVTFSVYLNPIDSGTVGSFYMYVDSFDAITANSVDTKGIAIQTETSSGGYFRVYDGKTSSWQPVRGITPFYFSGRWVQFKVVVKTWNDGTGFGYYDIYFNDGDDWMKVGADKPFASATLHDGVNAILFRPRQPDDSVLAYFDNIYISSTPLDCTDAKLLGATLDGDFDGDCDVDTDDLMVYTDSWLSCNNPGQDGCEPAVTLVSQDFENTALFSPEKGGVPAGDADTVDGSWLLIKPAPAYAHIDDTFALAHGPVLVQDFNDVDIFVAGTPLTSPIVCDGHGGKWRRTGSPDVVISDEQAYSGTQSMRVTRTSGGTLLGVSLANYIDVNTAEGFEVSCRLYRATSDASMVINFNQGDNTQTTPLALSLNIAGDGRLMVRNGGDTQYDGTNQQVIYVPQGQWVGLKMVVDLINSRSYTYYDDGSGAGFVYVDTHQLKKSALGNVNAVAFIPNPPAGNTCYIDDVAILPLATAVGQSLKMRRGGSDSKPYVRMRPIPEGVSYVAEAWLYRQDDTSSFAYFVGNSEGFAATDAEAMLYIAPNGNLRIYDYATSAYKPSGLYMQPRKWYLVRMVVDRTAGTYTGTIQSVGGGFEWTIATAATNPITNVNLFMINPQAPDGTITYSDNVRVTLSDELPDCAAVTASGLGYAADLNGDCTVDLGDFAVIAQNWLAVSEID